MYKPFISQCHCTLIKCSVPLFPWLLGIMTFGNIVESLFYLFCSLVVWKSAISFISTLAPIYCFCWRLLTTCLCLSVCLFLQCAAATWRAPDSSRRAASTSARKTTSGCTARSATAVASSSQERWSQPWAAPTTPSASSAASAGTVQHATIASKQSQQTPSRLKASTSTWFWNLQ